MAVFEQAIPCGHGGAGQCGGFFEREMVRNFHEPVFVGRNQFRQDARLISAPRSCDRGWRRRTARPSLKESRRHTIPDPESSHARTESNHLARTVR
jgi:hypothetical protein